MDSLNIYHLLVAFFETYIFNDWNVLTSLMVLVAIDTGTGVYAAWRTSTSGVYSFKLRSIFEKLWYYFIGFVVIHVLTNHLVDGEPNPAFIQIFPYFKGLLYFLMLGAEALSIDENASIVGYGFLPKWFRKKYNQVKEEGPSALQNTPAPVQEEVFTEENNQL